MQKFSDKRSRLVRVVKECEAGHHPTGVVFKGSGW